MSLFCKEALGVARDHDTISVVLYKELRLYVLTNCQLSNGQGSATRKNRKLQRVSK